MRTEQVGGTKKGGAEKDLEDCLIVWEETREEFGFSKHCHHVLMVRIFRAEPLVKRGRARSRPAV